MKHPLLGAWLFLALTALASSASATLADCHNLYVLRINTVASNASQSVVFAESPSAASGSYFTYLDTSLPDRAYQELSAMLLTAKSQMRTVSVTTDASGGCSIASGSYHVTQLELER